tara:strand:+ start:1764 stop:2525 length:762 start_codon:yes stop_codon:yes gene_type:complete
MIDTPIIDFHAHGGLWGRHGVIDNPQLFIKLMDSTGIDKACINSIYFGNSRWANNLVYNRFVKTFPNRFIGVAFVTPHYPEETVKELDHAFNNLEFKFLKLYPAYFGKPSDHPEYTHIYEWANEKQIPIMCHATDPADPPNIKILDRYEKFTTNYPNIKWVIAHGAEMPDINTITVAKELPNVWLETCGSPTPLHGISFAVNHGLADRILFGSDMPLMDHRHQIARIITIDISDEDKKKILGLNAIKLLNLEI